MANLPPRRRRCLLVFARPVVEEAAVKRLPGAAAVFGFARRRLDRAIASLPGVDLLIPAQRGDTFGERLLNALRDACERGYDQILAVPTDTPGLGRSQIAAGFDALERCPVALGLAPDGGVYLIGVTIAVDLRRLLGGVRWCTPWVATDLIAAAPGASLLPERLGDIDGRADLQAMSAQPDLDDELAALIASAIARPSIRPSLEPWRAATRPAAHRHRGRAPPASATV